MAVDAPIYLDNNATTPLLPEVADAMRECGTIVRGNAASLHGPGREARQWVEEARETVARVLGVRLAGPDADRLIFTSGGTEANNLAVLGMAAGPTGHVLLSAVEHPSVAGPADRLIRLGWAVDRLGVDASGAVHPGELANRLTSATRLVSVMLGNHETGRLQPVRDLAEIVAGTGVLLHTDAVQVVGKVPVDFRDLGVDALSCSAHKFHGPMGIGALALRHGVRIEPILHGGFQQSGLRPGTEPVALAVGMARALDLWHADRRRRMAHLTQLRDRFEAGIRAGWPDTVIHGGPSERLPSTSSVSLPGIHRQQLLMALDMAGIACSTGSACASGSSEPSPVLRAMGCVPEAIRSTMRFSWGATNTIEEVDQALHRILRVCNDLRRNVPSAKIGRSPPATVRNPL